MKIIFFAFILFSHAARALDIFKDVSDKVAPIVDQYIQSGNELRVDRNTGTRNETDQCDADLKNEINFADRISFAVDQNMVPRKALLSFISSAFSLPAKQDDFIPTSLISNPMCNVTATSLAQTIGRIRVPASATIQKINEFVDKYNQARTAILQNDPQGNVDMTRLWAKMFMCLSYTESLTTADTKTSEKVAENNAPQNFRRPAGVLFYNDPSQHDVASKLNIGLYQFSPAAGGNIYPCIQQWNQLYPTCQISSHSTTADMIRVLGSTNQTFNAFCGANKVSQMFSVQVNTSKAKFTHPLNKNEDGSLKSGGQRCVSLQFLPGNSYNHFGPFMNSTRSNLNELLTCTLAQ